MSARIRIPHGSVEFIKARVEADQPLTGGVEIAICRDLDEAVWHAAEWASDPGTERVARMLLDTGLLEPSARYNVFVRLTGGFETPIIDAGELLTVTS